MQQKLQVNLKLEFQYQLQIVTYKMFSEPPGFEREKITRYKELVGVNVMWDAR